MTTTTKLCEACDGKGGYIGELSGLWVTCSVCAGCRTVNAATTPPSTEPAPTSPAVQSVMHEFIRESRSRLEQLERAEQLVLALGFGEPRVTAHAGGDIELLWLERGIIVWVQPEGGYRLDVGKHVPRKHGPFESRDALRKYLRGLNY